MKQEDNDAELMRRAMRLKGKVSHACAGEDPGGDDSHWIQLASGQIHAEERKANAMLTRAIP